MKRSAPQSHIKMTRVFAHKTFPSSALGGICIFSSQNGSFPRACVPIIGLTFSINYPAIFRTEADKKTLEFVGDMRVCCSVSSSYRLKKARADESFLFAKKNELIIKPQKSLSRENRQGNRETVRICLFG